jgi:hypothetical protein
MTKVYLLIDLSTRKIVAISKIDNFAGRDREDCELLEFDALDLPASLQLFDTEVRYKFIEGLFIAIPLEETE